jgi:hypothetical protein
MAVMTVEPCDRTAPLLVRALACGSGSAAVARPANTTRSPSLATSGA